MTSNIDYVHTYFKYPTPTPINGEPTNKSLKRLKNELRANASSVDSDLGGGDHGYLGLVLTDIEYSNVSATAFVAPPFPRTLTIPVATTAVQALQLRETHKEEARIYRECKNIERALLRHIQTALEEKYIEHLIDDDTGLIEDDIPDVLEFLFNNYGKVTSEEVKDKEAEVLNISFNPADPMVIIYRPIEQLQKLATSADIPYSNEQLLEFGRNTRDFEKALGEWYAKPDHEKSWSNFKTHFKTAQTELKEIRGPTMQQAGYHHANMLAEQIRTDFGHQNEQIMAMMQNIANVAESQSEPSSEPSVQLANATTVDTNQQILQLLRTMQQQLTSNNTPNNSERRGRNRRTPDNASFNRRVKDKYCWTHGACNHASGDCSRKAPGHRDEATFANRMGGSNAFCPP